MTTVAINITGPTYKSRSPYQSNQSTINFYPEVTEGGKSEYVLHPFPGLSSFAAAVAPGRGLFTHVDSSGNEILYQLAGETLYSVDSSGNRTNLGAIAGSALAIFAGVGTDVVIVSSGTAWTYDGAAVAEITDSDLETPNSCAHINNQIIFDGDGGRFASSDVGDAASINSLNYATAESNADNLVRVYTYDQLLDLYGNKTVEVFQNTGVGNPPFERLEGGIIQVGLGALHSIASNDQITYFLGDDRQIYVKKGVSARRVSSIGISREIEGFSTVSDAHASCFGFGGKNFYRITFPTAGRSFCYSESSSDWFELQSGNSRYRASSQTLCYGKNLVEDAETGAIYELDVNAFNEAGESVTRVRDSAPLHGGMVGAPGKLLCMDRFELLIETGMGTSEGQGSEPEVMVSFSDDGGRTFGTEMFGSLGVAGEFIYKVEFFGCGSFYSRIIRVRISDPVLCTIHGAAADLTVGI